MSVSWTRSPIKGVLLDISGVLRDGEIPIPGSIQAFQRLKTSGIPVRLVTNETQKTREQSVCKLLEMGYKDIQLQDVSAPAPNLAKALKEWGLRPHLLVHPDVLPEFQGLEMAVSDADADCVVIGDAAAHFTYETMNRAFRTLFEIQNSGRTPRLFTLGKGRYYKEDDLLWLDVGPFCAALEYATDLKAELFGKPDATFFQGAMKSIVDVSPGEVVMIGDDIVGDVKGAQDAGLRGVLVRTGKYLPTDENHPTVKPDGVVNDLSEAVDLILSVNK